MFSGFGRKVNENVAGLSSNERRLLCNHRDDDCAQSAIVSIALNDYRGPQFGACSFTERKIDQHHIATINLHDRLCDYEFRPVACPSGTVQSSSSRTLDVQSGKVVWIAGGVVRTHAQGVEQVFPHDNTFDVGVGNYVLDDDAILDRFAFFRG